MFNIKWHCHIVRIGLKLTSDFSHFLPIQYIPYTSISYLSFPTMLCSQSWGTTQQVSGRKKKKEAGEIDKLLFLPAAGIRERVARTLTHPSGLGIDSSTASYAAFAIIMCTTVR